MLARRVICQEVHIDVLGLKHMTFSFLFRKCLKYYHRILSGFNAIVYLLNVFFFQCSPLHESTVQKWHAP